MNASFSNALATAREAAGHQHYPQGALYVVATPIGNLADITLRALHVLAIADTIACEDTRHTQTLLRAYGIEKSSHQLLAVHQHNEAEASGRVLEKLHAGERVAYVSDAGTPAVSDPGARLAHAVTAGGLRVLPLPGASSITTALSAAGLVHDSGHFVFEGFLSTRSAERDAAVRKIAAEPRAVVLLEAPHRIEALATALVALGTREITLARELTKQFESIHTLPASDVPAWLQEDTQRTRGEFVVVVHAAAAVTEPGDDAGARALKLLLDEGVPLKSAVKIAAQWTGGSRNTLYDLALSLRKDAVRDTD
ncbi:16S rRNA (cytidine(1402)-2'-O)-methyltransferase [Variovorax sp. VNK109]|uniref:16S rRNA (cytidine(1402)-2'-O)-methyltransferase n=1 Tax=Variovorax sp. VNK109 TaxID=3400919 RepID=UPI003C0B609C